MHTLFQVIPNGSDRQILDANTESTFEAFDILRKISYGLQSIGIETKVVMSGEDAILKASNNGKNVSFILVQQ